MWFRIALRNLSRNARRTLLTLGVIALGTAMSFGLSGYMEDALGKLRSETVKQFGNFQIADPVFWEDNVLGQAAMIEPDYLTEIQSAIDAYSAEQEFDLATSPQTEISGLVTDAARIYSRVVTMIGFEPDNPALDYNDIVVEEYVDPNNETLAPGIEPGAETAVLIGESLANEFNAQVGGRVNFSTRTITGQVVQRELFVKGIFQRNDVQDESSIIYVPPADTQNLLRSDNVTKLVVTLDDIEETDRAIREINGILAELASERERAAREAYEIALAEHEVAMEAFQAIRAEYDAAIAARIEAGEEVSPAEQFGGPQPPPAPVEPEALAPLQIKSWEELSTYYRQVSGFFDALFAFLTFAVILLVFFIVYQVLSMSFLERTREVGTIRAIGTMRQQVFTMFITESVILGVLGGLLGLVLGLLLAQGVNAAQFGWTPPGAIREVPVELSLGLNNAYVPFLISALATLLSALLPSIHSARIQIVDALRTN